MIENSLPQLFPIPAKAGNLVSPVHLCWVCEKVFPEYGGNDSGLVQEFHHIIPRAYGGAEGPTVSLCSGHHTLLHEMAQKMIQGKSFHALLSRNESVNNRLLYLASRVQLASATMSDDPNKRLTLVASISKEEARKMSDLYSLYGVKSREALVKKLIAEAYNRHFPQLKKGSHT